MTSRRTFASFVLALALAGLVAAGCGRRGDAETSRGPGPAGRLDATTVVPIEVAPVVAGRIARDVNVSGVVEPIRVIGVNNQISGALRTVDVQEGDVVREGTVLATFDDREPAAQLRSAAARLEVAQGTFDRSSQLRDRQVITAAEFERDRAALEAAKAEVDQLRARVGYATVRSPLAGVVTVKSVEAGDVVGNQTRLFSIADESAMVVRVKVSELDVVELSEGASVDVRLDAFPGRVFTGHVRRIFPAADPATRLVPVEVALDAAAARAARPGFLARVTFGLQPREDVRLIPAGAIVGTAGQEAVFVVAGDTVARKPVRVGLVSKGRVEVTDGLETGELVVVAGANNLRSGSRVRVVDGPGAEEPGLQQQRSLTPDGR